MEKNSKQNIGNAGEYYIASRLSAENFIATITLGRAEKYDILAINPLEKTIKLSVKTGYLKSVTEFPLSQKDEEGGSEDFYYAFVKLNEFEIEPEFWVIPSLIVNKILADSDRIYSSTPGRKGQARKSTSLRIMPVVVSKYNESFYPKTWENDLKKYYKNIKQLKQLINN